MMQEIGTVADGFPASHSMGLFQEFSSSSEGKADCAYY